MIFIGIYYYIKYSVGLLRDNYLNKSINFKTSTLNEIVVNFDLKIF